MPAKPAVVPGNRKRPFWTDGDAQRDVAQTLSQAAKSAEAWFVLLVAPSELIGVDNEGRGTDNQHLWGHTGQGYGEAIANFLRRNCSGGVCEGLVFELLKRNPELRTKVLKALFKEQTDGTPLEDQKLYETLVD